MTDVLPAHHTKTTHPAVQVSADVWAAHWHILHAVQVRPLLSFEKAKSSSECVDVPSTTVVQLPPRRGTSSDPFRFDFDRVYKMNNPGAGESLHRVPTQELVLAAAQGEAV